MTLRVDEFVLGSMSVEDREAMMRARRHDGDLDRTIRAAETRLAPLALASDEMPPGAGLWHRIVSAIAEESRAMQGRTVIELQEGEWRPVAPGIESKFLWNRRTELLRCAPGSVMPDHTHEATEFLLVLSGDLIIGGRTFSGGDYIISGKGADHFVHSTRGGCLVLSQIAG